MAYQQFKVSSENPNDNAGGGGCVCDPRQQCDCKGPYIVCEQNEMFDHLSPHVVIGAACVDAFYAAIHGGKDALVIGEKNTITTADQSVMPTVRDDNRVEGPVIRTRDDSPVVESPDPRKDFAPNI